MEAYERSLKELEDALGEDLNLAILGERVQFMASENGSGPKPAPLTMTIDDARKELRGGALDIGEKVYAEKPKEFTRQIRRLWKAW